nr:uncharacterized protein K02A2.6-like [Maniola hyperantus]
MEHARPPTELVVEGGPASRADAWRTWRKQFQVFLKASGVAKEPADVQASLLINLIGPAGYDVFTTFTYDKGESEDNIGCLLKKFDEHFGTKPNITLARFKFFTRSQDSGETIDQYVTALRVLSQYCEFAQLRDSLIRDRIVCGISNNTVRDRLLRTEDLTLAKAVQICEAAEMSKEESRLIEASTTEASVDAIWKESGRGAASASRGGGGGRRRLRGTRAAWGTRMETLGVIRKVSHPTDWVNAIVVVAKKNGDIRLCLDPRPLNRAIRRAHYSLPTVTELAIKLRDAKYFSVLDARSSFWMIELDDASANLCTFGTPFGRYQFLRLPFGINCASEVFHAKIKQHLEGLEGTDSFIDDIIVWGRTKEEHDMRLESLLHRSKDIGIKYNFDKCKFCVQEIIFLGHKFNSNGMQPDDSKVKAILDMPYPSDRKALERFLGMVNYLSKFIPNYSESVAVLRNLLRKDSEWAWYSKHSEAVDTLKKKLSTAPVLALYSMELPVVVSVDASAHALGAVLLQAGRPVEFASLTLTDTQARYAQIEKEMLAIVFAVERFRQYLFGRRDITVQSDHKPLEALCGKSLASVPIRLQRMMMRIQGYDLKVVYTPGKYMYIADTLSRAALPDLMNDRISAEIESQTCFLIQNIRFSDEKLELVKKHIDSDPESKSIISYIVNGWPKHKKNVNENLRLFWQYRNALHYANGLIFKSDVLYIPQSLRKLMLDRVHEGHLGIDRCKRRARDVMFWPGMSRDVERAVRGCEACALHAPAPRVAPLNQHYVPNIPWQKLGSDIFEYKKKHYIILIDYFSNYVEVGMIRNLSSTSVINFLREQFARHGVPLELITDNSTAYSSLEFKKFMAEWDVRHVTSSPHYPQSNGKSERTVQTIKQLLKKCIDSGQDFYVSLLNFRTTSREGMDSPAQILMGRRLNTKLPINHKLLKEKVDNDANYSAILKRQKGIKQHFDKHATPLRDLSAGERVILADGVRRKPVSVVARAPEPRSYFVRDDAGRVCRRTRRHLIARTTQPDANTHGDNVKAQTSNTNDHLVSTDDKECPPHNAKTVCPTPTKPTSSGVITRKKANLLGKLQN